MVPVPPRLFPARNILLEGIQIPVVGRVQTKDEGTPLDEKTIEIGFTHHRPKY